MNIQFPLLLVKFLMSHLKTSPKITKWNGSRPFPPLLKSTPLAYYSLIMTFLVMKTTTLKARTLMVKTLMVTIGVSLVNIGVSLGTEILKMWLEMKILLVMM
jgi:hypothetical protein